MHRNCCTFRVTRARNKKISRSAGHMLRFYRSPADGDHADIIEIKLSGGAVESDAKDHFFGIWRDGDDGPCILPLE